MEQNVNDLNNVKNVGKMAKIGVLFLTLWSILHIWVGIEGVTRYNAGGADALWELMIGGINAPHPLFRHAKDILTLNAHKQLLLNFCLDVSGYGVLGLFLSWLIYKKGSWNAYFIALIVIGLCDLSFLFSMVTSGIIELNFASVSGPIIWFIAVICIPFGLPKMNKSTIVNKQVGNYKQRI